MSFRQLMDQELERIKSKKIQSFHEAFGLILEEVDEFKAEVWKKPKQRDPVNLVHELVQIATLAQRTAEDLGLLDKP